MLAALNDNGNADTDDREPGAAMRFMARMLAERGLDVRVPLRRKSCCLTVFASPMVSNARCEIVVEDDDESVSLQYFPGSSGGDTGPTEISEIVLRLLDACNTGPAKSYTHLHKGGTLRGAVAREMRARGLKADLNVYEDTLFCDVAIEVEITNPARHERGQVYVTNDGVIEWECDYKEMAERAETIADTAAEILNNCR